MSVWTTSSASETEAVGARLGAMLKTARVVALYGGLGLGKTAFVRGMAAGMGLTFPVSSPTFALVHEYGGHPPLVHFDMYRVEGWEDLDTTGFFEYIDSGAVVVVEWSENIEAALPDNAIRVRFRRLSDTERIMEIELPEDLAGMAESLLSTERTERSHEIIGN